MINDAGQAAFRPTSPAPESTATNNQGIWSEGSGSLALVARTGSAAPGAPDGVNFGLNPALELFEPVLNNAGQTAFYGGLTDGTRGTLVGRLRQPGAGGPRRHPRPGHTRRREP